MGGRGYPRVSWQTNKPVVYSNRGRNARKDFPQQLTVGAHNLWRCGEPASIYVCAWRVTVGRGLS